MPTNILYGFVLLLFVISCNDKDSPIDPPTDPVKKCRLVKMIQGTNNGAVNDTTFNFYYDAAGKLYMVTGSYAGYRRIDTSLITYNDSGKLVKISTPGSAYGTTFSYTSNGLLSEINHSSYDPMRMRYVYNGTSILPEKCVAFRLSGTSGTPLDTTEYRYTSQNGNIVSSETFRGGVSRGKSTFEFDTIPNLNADLALIDLFDQPLLFGFEFFYFNKNMFKKGGSTYLTYKLDSGRLVQSLTYKDQNQLPSATRNYFWECN
ncbi:hypothetical protein A4H97_31025 [Niastella yeongjuensis]|uniref:DUF4595 domain-containing protein n=1 Tax=Niastella yeongjuensis TaxID=354355 RepID=A0A1V9ENS5_9BACT|nr:hypothetical protein [Niastella yeongjuensis]OQP47798.1 hypothetical protein A4H97_31025 [Niastella yeongjuensis]SEP45198.1 hypothetical protein SAMN05660816_06298 [Niastella yeongjuensis]